MWCAWILSPCEKFWLFEFLESSCCSISSVSICDAPESDIRVKTYDHFNFSRIFVVQFRASLYSKRLNRTSVWKVMTIWISRELSLFNFERLDMWCAWIGPPCETFWPFEFLESSCCLILSVSICDAPELHIRVKSYDHFNFSRISVVQFRASLYIKCLNRTSVWKVMTIWISRELPFFNFERLDILSVWIEHSSEKSWPIEFLESFRCSISSVSIYYAPESDIQVKSYDHLKISLASVVQFRASRHVMCLNRSSMCKVMTIIISRELPLFNFEGLDIWCARIGPPCEKFWPFQFLDIFRCSISGVPICDVPESDLLVITYDYLNFSRTSIVQFRASRYLMCLNRTSEWQVMTILISREFPLFNNQCLDTLGTWIRNPSEKLWPF